MAEEGAGEPEAVAASGLSGCELAPLLATVTPDMPLSRRCCWYVSTGSQLPCWLRFFEASRVATRSATEEEAEEEVVVAGDEVVGDEESECRELFDAYKR